MEVLENHCFVAPGDPRGRKVRILLKQYAKLLGLSRQNDFGFGFIW